MTDWWDSIDRVARFNNWVQGTMVAFGFLIAAGTALTITLSIRIASLQAAREEVLMPRIIDSDGFGWSWIV
jgi:cell division protein FtsX